MAPESYRDLVKRVVLESGRSPGDWDRDSVLRVIRIWCNAKDAEVAIKIMDWVEAHEYLDTDFGGKLGDGGYYARLGQDGKSKPFAPFVIWTYGKVEILFKHMNRPPFDEQSRREEFRQRLLAIPNVEVDIPDTSLTRRPNIPLSRMRSEERLASFFSAVDWWVDEIRQTPSEY